MRVDAGAGELYAPCFAREACDGAGILLVSESYQGQRAVWPSRERNGTSCAVLGWKDREARGREGEG